MDTLAKSILSKAYDEQERLRALNAELVESLGFMRNALQLAYNDVPGWTEVFWEAMNASSAVLEKVKER